MFTIINANNLKETNYDELDGKEHMIFQVGKKYPGAKELQVSCKLPCFSHNVDTCKTMKQAEELISTYYKKNYYKLVQLKKLGNLRCELRKKIINGEIRDVIPVINEHVTQEQFPQVDTKYIRDTEYDLFRTLSATI